MYLTDSNVEAELKRRLEVFDVIVKRRHALYEALDAATETGHPILAREAQLLLNELTFAGFTR